MAAKQLPCRIDMSKAQPPQEDEVIEYSEDGLKIKLESNIKSHPVPAIKSLLFGLPVNKLWPDMTFSALSAEPRGITVCNVPVSMGTSVKSVSRGLYLTYAPAF